MVNIISKWPIGLSSPGYILQKCGTIYSKKSIDLISILSLGVELVTSSGSLNEPWAVQRAVPSVKES